MIDQALISAIIFVTLTLFVWGRWRYEVVALVALLVVTILGLLPPDEVFLGFVHPIVVLIFSMLIISTALVNSGVVDIVGRYLKFANRHFIWQMGILVFLTVFLSAFVSSIGALAFVIPIAVRMARQTEVPLSSFLMPIAFASLFGGGITLVGSPSNIIVSGFRAEEIGEFNFFDFAYVALPIALVNAFFVIFIGWRLVPKRQSSFSENLYRDNYVTEVKILEGSPIIGKSIEGFYDFSKEDFTIFALMRGQQYISDPSPFSVLKEGDVLVIEAGMPCLESIITTAGLELVYKKSLEEDEKYTKDLEKTEVVVPSSSYLIGETAKNFDFYNRYRVNLLALHRAGERIKARLKNVKFKSGDVLVIQGYPEYIDRFLKSFSLLPLKEKDFNLEGKRGAALIVTGLFSLAVLVAITTDLPVHLVFGTSAVAMLVAGFVSLRKMNGSFDFSMIIVLAVMVQLGSVFYETGAASSLANLLFLFDSVSPMIALAVVLISSIWFADLLGNVTVAVILAPVAFAVAKHLGVSPDPYLMAVAIGCGSSYLTPIGHQSNIFVMGIGGYRFSDYWRLGLPLEMLTFAMGMLLIPFFWPF